MADTQAGIMALPENQDVQGPTLGLDDTYDAVKQALGAARPDASVEMDSAMTGLKGVADELTDEQLDSMMQLVQYLYDNKDKYKELVAELVTAGIVENGDLPAEYDPEFLSTFGTILLEERRSRGADQPPFPEKFARGGIAEAARIVANQGRSGDTMLAHITPEEARMLRKMGGVGTINPATGLPEFGFLDFIVKPLQKIGSAVTKVFKSVVNGVKQVLASPVGKVVGTIALATFLGPAGMGIANAGWASAIASGTTTLAAGGNIKDAVKSAAFSYFVTPSTPASQVAVGAPAFNNPIYDWVGKTTEQFAGANNFVANALENQYVKTAVTGFGTGTAAGLLTGQNLQDAVKGGLTGAAIATGVQAAGNGVQNFKDNAKIGAEIVDDVNATQGAQAMQSRSANPNVELARDLEDFLPADQVMTGGRAGTPTGSNGIADLAAKAKANLTPGEPAIMSQPNYAEAQGVNQAANDAWNKIVREGAPVSVEAGTAPTITPTTAATAPYKVPGILDSSKQIGGGILDIAKGDFSKGYENIVKGGGDLFFPSTPPAPTTSEVINSESFKNAIASGVTPDAALKSVTAELTQPAPGILRTYGPAAAAGLGITALAGGFTPPEQPQSEQGKLLSGTPGEDKIKEDPSKYIVQNIPGVTYDTSGQMVSSTTAPSTVSMQDVRVSPAGYTTTIQDVSRPTSGSLIGPMQPQAPLMDPYQYYYQQYLASQGQPRYYAMGGITGLSAPMQAPPTGIASLRDGGNSNYPRRTGQIAGPGTEKSDSIPAMLSDGEFVMTAAAVRGMGKGSRREGAKRMYALMHQLEKNAARG
jgi:hypothetical protein